MAEVMAVFGVPRVHEDDAMRGVRAALELQQLLGRMNDELLRDKYGVGLVLRIGVNTREEYRIALALGAQRRCRSSGSGGAASALLSDPTLGGHGSTHRDRSRAGGSP